MIKVNSILTLENNEKYVVLSETMYQGLKYFLMVGLDENKELIESNVAIFREERSGIDSYVVKVVEPKLLTTLTKLLKAQM